MRKSFRSPPTACQTTLFVISMAPSVMIARFPRTFVELLFPYEILQGVPLVLTTRTT